MSQKDVAAALGYSRNYIWMVESETKDPGPGFREAWEQFERDRGLTLSEQPAVSGPRGLLKETLAAHQMTAAELAKRIGYEIGPVQAVVDGGARISESMAEAIERELPELEKEALLGGSDTPRITTDSGTYGTMGAKPQIAVPKGMDVRMVPLISWAQAGAMSSYDDEVYSHEAIPVFDVPDRKAFALTVRGNSMTPEINEGDKVIVCPSWQPRNGDEVICRTVDGDVMCKIYHSKEGGKIVILSSYNSGAHPPFELNRDEIAWIYPVQGVQKTRRSS
jgi:phage repressor protein C with HTH and peptisase S24 domain